MIARFLGIDFGWCSQPSGVCCLEWRGDALYLLHLDRLLAVETILQWVDTWQIATTLIAVDAPTIIPNPTGMRVPDRLTHQYFRQYHGGCYPANLSRPFAQRTVSLGRALEARGFVHAPQIVPQAAGKYQIEVFPHPAIVHLFRLDRILKYKKGLLTDRKRELGKLRTYIETVLAEIEPKLHLEQPLPSIPDKGTELKIVEDQLDSLICAYVGAYWWYWGSSRNLTLGSEETGYIIVPQALC